MRSSCASVRDIQEYVNDNSRLFIENAAAHRMDCDKSLILKQELVGVVMWATSIRQVNNAYSCPFNGVTNWGMRPNRPKGYSGLGGNIHISMARQWPCSPPCNTSALFFKTGINLGSGGGGVTVDTSYGVSIFFDDWPLLKAMYELEEL
jgi:hypothetical protein